MSQAINWEADLSLINGLMRDLSRQSDPQAAAAMYGKGLREWGFVRTDEWLSASRRNLSHPQYRITRSSRWKVTLNPWKQTAELPMYDRGLLGELLYANQPAVIRDLPGRLQSSDPMHEDLSGFKMLIMLPMYDEGESINSQILLLRDSDGFQFDRVPVMVWQANLWGRAVSNLVLRQELQEAFARLKQAHAALDREMTNVGQVQRSLLPTSTEALGSLDVAVHYQTSQRAGGDYYDFFRQNDGGCGILIADVSGHGAAAAVLMAVTHALAQLHPGAGCPPSALLGFLNEHLARKYTGDSGSFVTAFYGVLDSVARRLIYASAGHPQPRIVRDGAVSMLSAQGGFPLGIEPAEQYAEAKSNLLPGDRIIFYTDGITEARNGTGELFGVERLDGILRGCVGSSAEMLDRILNGVARFTGDRDADDDRTLIVVGV